MSINRSFVRLNEERRTSKRICITLHPYLFTPNYFYSFHLVWVSLLFSRRSSRHFRFRLLWMLSFLHLKSTIHIWFEHANQKMWMRSLWAYHIIFIHLASYLNLFEHCVSFSIYNRHIPPWKLCGWRNMKEEKKKKRTRKKRLHKDKIENKWMKWVESE